LNEQQRPTRARYVVVTFMVTLAMVTYLDRACIAVMKPNIAADFALDAAQMGWVFTVFSLAYALFEIPTARWADRKGAGSVLARIVTWWSVFTLMTAGAFNYVSLLVTRFLFGAGEAGAFPCVARVLSRWMPLRERGTAKGIFFAGAYASAALTTFMVGELLPIMNWRTILLVFGCVGFVWVVAWRRWFRDEPTDHPAANDAERALILADRIPIVSQSSGWAYWRGLLRQRNVVLLCLSYMPNCAAFYFCISWLPSYLREHLGFEGHQLSFFTSLPLLLSIAPQFLGGFFSDRIVVRFGLRTGRRAPGVVGYGVAALLVIAATLSPDSKTAAVLFALTVATCMLTTAASWSTCVDIGREHSATVSATMNTAGQVAAIVMPLVVGYSLKWFDNWNAPFYFLAGLFVMGAVCWMFIDPRNPVFEAQPA
jgi:MFS family permease